MKIFKHRNKNENLPVSIPDNFLADNPDKSFLNLSAFESLPSVNISENDNSYKFSMALPGFKKEQINIEIEDHCLLIYSDKNFENVKKEKNWVRKEYSYTSFCRKFRIPEDADIEKITAKMKRGVLNINIEKDLEKIKNKKNIVVK